MKPPTALIFEQTPILSTTLSGALDRGGFETIQVQNPNRLCEVLKARRPDLVILGACALDPLAALDLAMQVRKIAARIPIILIVVESSEELAIAALRAGVNEYVKTPFAPQDLILSIKRCLGKNPSDGGQWDANVLRQATSRLVGDSAPMKEVRAQLAKIAATDSNVLITGETGTGKELVAEQVHQQSFRRCKPLTTINCAAIPDSIFESELFGYERGAFTGAEQCQEGRLKGADGGTVFFDEIGDMCVYGQAKVLRLIESHEIQRLGRSCGLPVDIRIIAATNRNLEELAAQGHFRKDLFFRLAVTTLHLPPLRERKEDLLALVAHYLCYYNQRFGRAVRALSEEAMDLLLAYDWPGNVRELKNVLEAVFVELPANDDMEVAELPARFRSRYAESKHVSADERARLLSALSATNWNKSRAALKLHWSRMTLYRKMARYNIQAG